VKGRLGLDSQFCDIHLQDAVLATPGNGVHDDGETIIPRRRWLLATKEEKPTMGGRPHQHQCLELGGPLLLIGGKDLGLERRPRWLLILLCVVYWRLQEEEKCQEVF